VVNTRGFLEASKEESLSVIREALERKDRGELKRVVVAGCLVQRHRAKILEWAPGVDSMIGVFDRDRVVEAVTGVTPSRTNLGSDADHPPYWIAANALQAAKERGMKTIGLTVNGADGKGVGYFESDANRFRLTPRHWAYLRASEGCNQRCAFCTIPSIRGKMRSKSLDDVVAEAGALMDEAESEFQNAGISACEVPLLKARLARHEGQTDKAMALAQSQLQAMTPRNPYFLQYQILIADLLCARGDVAGAAREMARVNRKSLATAAPAIQADAAWIRARMALLDNKPHVAGGFLDAAAGYFQQAGQYVDMALALEAAGHAYETAGDFDVAMDRYYRAARTLLLAGQVGRGERAMTRAVLLADQSGQTEMRKKLKQLQTDINAARSN